MSVASWLLPIVFFVWLFRRAGSAMGSMGGMGGKGPGGMFGIGSTTARVVKENVGTSFKYVKVRSDQMYSFVFM